MNNVIIATALNDNVRIYLADTTLMVEKARRIHHLYPTSLAALGRTLSITSLMALKQKNKEETITNIINGGGIIGTIMAVANNEGEVKGFVSNKEVYLKNEVTGKLDVGKAVGNNGYLKVIKNLKLKNNYNSQVALQSGEIGDDFSYYFNISEQIPSIVSLGVLVDIDYSCKSAGALLIELLPNHKEEDIKYLENLLKDLKPISLVLLNDRNLEHYLFSLFPNAKILERKNVRYHCDCNKDRFIKGLLTLPKKDLLELSSQDKIEIKCEFCDKTYIFNKDDINF